MDFDRGFLKKNIEEQRWSITALANKLDVGRSTIHLWLKGHHEPPNDKLIEISKLLNLSVLDTHIDLYHRGKILKATSTLLQN